MVRPGARWKSNGRPRSEEWERRKGRSAAEFLSRLMGRPPTPNPPLVPFPTPPPSRQRHVRLPTPTFELPSSPTTSHSKMPHHLETLLKLQHAINVALSLHIATRPPVLPPHSSSTTKIPLPNLTTYPAIRETVERSAGRRFGLPELARLAWIWTWDGITITRPSRNENENPFLADSPKREKEISGMSYLVTPTRTLDSSTGRRVHTYGLGIELDLKKGETRQVLHGGNEGGLGNKGQGGGTGAIARWNAGGEAREEMVKERLTRWVELHGGFEVRENSDQPGNSCCSPTSQTRGSQRLPRRPASALPFLPSLCWNFQSYHHLQPPRLRIFSLLHQPRPAPGCRRPQGTQRAPLAVWLIHLS